MWDRLDWFFSKIEMISIRYYIFFSHCGEISGQWLLLDSGYNFILEDYDVFKMNAGQEFGDFSYHFHQDELDGNGERL